MGKMIDRMKTKGTGKGKKVRGLMPKAFEGAISSRSRKMLDHSAANLKKGLASAPIELVPLLNAIGRTRHY